MKYKILTPLARIGQPFFVGDLIEIENKAEAERMIAAGIVAALNVASPKIGDKREIKVETADAQLIGVEKAVKISRKKG